MAAPGSTPPPPPAAEANPLVVERYKYILQQIHTVNENVYRFLAIYQTIVTALVTAAIALFVNYKTWNVTPDIAHTALTALLLLATAVAAFTIVMIVIGAMSWLDYRKEECEFTDEHFMPGFRTAPKPGNLWRWYETYIVFFVIIVTVGLWILAEVALLPRVV